MFLRVGVAKYCKLHGKMLTSSVNREPHQPRPLRVWILFESGSLFLVPHSCTQTSFQGPFLPGAKCLQCLCISLCRSLLKSMSYPFSEHAERLILAETVVNFYALAYAGDCWKSISYPSSEHAERLILAETVCKLYALAYAGDCSKLWVILSQSMQKGWY